MPDPNLLSAAPDSTWATPGYVYDPLHEVYRFQIDTAASAENTKCPVFITALENSFETDWLEKLGVTKESNPKAWTNPPYNLEDQPLYQWVFMAFWRARDQGFTTFNLLPPNIDNRWFFELVCPGGIVNGAQDDVDIECYTYRGGLKDQSPGWKYRDNTSRIQHVQPKRQTRKMPIIRTSGGIVEPSKPQKKSSPSKGSIGVVYRPSWAEKQVPPPEQWQRMF